MSEPRIFSCGWLIPFDDNGGDDDALIQYNSLLKYIDEDAINFSVYQQHLPTNLIPPPVKEMIHHNETRICCQ